MLCARILSKTLSNTDVKLFSQLKTKQEPEYEDEDGDYESEDGSEGTVTSSRCVFIPRSRIIICPLSLSNRRCFFLKSLFLAAKAFFFCPPLETNTRKNLTFYHPSHDDNNINNRNVRRRRRRSDDFRRRFNGDSTARHETVDWFTNHAATDAR